MKKFLSTLLAFTLIGSAVAVKSGMKVSAAANNFYVSGTKLLDPNGNNFVMRGVNLPVAWYPSSAPSAIPDIATQGANAVRILWDSKRSDNTTTLLDSTLQKCIDNRLVPVLVMHYGSENINGSNDPTVLNDAVNYWTGTAKSIIQKYQKYLILNIENEWYGSWPAAGDTTYSNTYVNAVKSIRTAGITAPIMVDAPGYAQDWSWLETVGSTILNADTNKNVIFGVHMYEVFNSLSTVQNCFSGLNNSGLAVVASEFAPTNNGQTVDYTDIMDQAQSYGKGYLAYDWYENSTNTWNMFNGWLASSGTTTWGNNALNRASSGIRTSSYSVNSSVFSGTYTDACNDFTKVFASSSGWSTDNTNPTYFNNDTGRFKRNAITTEYLTYKVSNMKSYKINAYYLGSQDYTLTLQVSADNATWTTLTPTKSTATATAGGWYNMTYSGSVGSGMHYLKATLSGGSKAYSLEIAKVDITY